MIKFYCDNPKCLKEIIEKQEVVNIQYADKKVLSKEGQFINTYVEVKKILSDFYQQEGKEVDAIYLTGGTSGLPGLREYFAEVFIFLRKF